MRELAVVTTVYPAVEPFLAKYLGSLHAQTDTDFTLYVVNEGLRPEALVALFRGFDLRLVDGGASPAENRRRGLEALIAADVRLAVMTDADDTFSPTRVADSRRGLRRQPVVFNELVVDGQEIISPRIPPGSVLEWRDILDYNVLGLSNTSVHVALLEDQLQHIGTDPDVVDWGLFTRILLGGARAEFLPSSCTYYRRYAVNLAVTDDTNPEAIMRAVRVKARHYTSLASLHVEFAERARQFSALLATLQRNPQRARDYLRQCASSVRRPSLWWEIALPPAMLAEQAFDD